jgi:hypothetical protein
LTALLFTMAALFIGAHLAFVIPINFYH